MNSRLAEAEVHSDRECHRGRGFVLLIDVVAHLQVALTLRSVHDLAGVVVAEAEKQEVGGDTQVLAGKVGAGEAGPEVGLDASIEVEGVHEGRVLHRLVGDRPESLAPDVRARDGEDDA